MNKNSILITFIVLFISDTDIINNIDTNVIFLFTNEHSCKCGRINWTKNDYNCDERTHKHSSEIIYNLNQKSKYSRSRLINM